MSKKTPIKGKPDFTALSDDKLRGFIELAQQMIFTYQYCDEEKTRVMKEVWKDMSDEYSDRQNEAPFIQPVEEESAPSIHKIKTVKTLKRIKH